MVPLSKSALLVDLLVDGLKSYRLPVCHSITLDQKLLFFSLALSFIILFGLFSECDSGPLGMASGDIPDTSITASSYEKHGEFDREPKYARLGGERFWVSFDVEPWIQVDLDSHHIVTGLQTQGDDGWKEYWVEQIKVQVGFTEENLMFIQDANGQPKVC